MAKKRGRKPFKATATLRRKVQELLCAGLSQDEIARAIGCSTPTLVKHFETELLTGAAVKRAEVIGLLFKSAKKGNVAAQKKLEEMSRLAAVAGSPAQPQAKMPTGKIGKKQIEAAAAASAGGEGTEWGNDLRPRIADTTPRTVN